MKMKMFLSITLMVTLALIACNKGGSSGSVNAQSGDGKTIKSTEALLVGKWLRDKYADPLEFFSDGKADMDGDKAFWKIEKGQIIISWNGQILTAKVSDSILTIYYEEGHEMGVWDKW
jgi:hypothetical protein